MNVVKLIDSPEICRRERQKLPESQTDGRQTFCTCMLCPYSTDAAEQSYMVAAVQKVCFVESPFYYSIRQGWGAELYYDPIMLVNYTECSQPLPKILLLNVASVH